MCGFRSPATASACTAKPALREPERWPRPLASLAPTPFASLAGDPIAVDLSAAGPWLPPEQFSSTNGVSPEPQPIPPLPPQSTEAPAIAASITPAFDTLAGTVIVRNANWKADYLANHLEISEATLHLDSVDLRWDPVAFSYGPLNGTASMTVPLSCPSDQQPARPCPAQFQIHFDDLDVAALETALLGAREKGTLLSDLIERFHPSTAPPWPQLEGTVAADSLVLGPVTLQQVAAILRILPASARDHQLRCRTSRWNCARYGVAPKTRHRSGQARLHIRGRFPEAQRRGCGQPRGAALDRRLSRRQWQSRTHRLHRQGPWRPRPRACFISKLGRE